MALSQILTHCLPIVQSHYSYTRSERLTLFFLKQMAILHGYSTLSGNFDPKVNPKAYIRRKGDDTNYRTVVGEDLQISVAELLEIAGKYFPITTHRLPDCPYPD